MYKLQFTARILKDGNTEDNDVIYEFEQGIKFLDWNYSKLVADIFHDVVIKGMEKAKEKDV